MDRKQGLHKCVGLERMATGMSTDSLLEPQFSRKLCQKLKRKTGQPWIWIRKGWNRPKLKLKTRQPWLWIWKTPKRNLKTVDLFPLFISVNVYTAWRLNPNRSNLLKALVGSCGSDRQAVGSVPCTCRIRTIFMVRSASLAIRLSTSGVHPRKRSKGSTIPTWRPSSDWIRGF